MKISACLLGALAVSMFITPAWAQAKGGNAPKATDVVVSKAYTDNIVDKVEAIGSLRANETITLASTVTETVTSVNFEDGQRVKKGDIIVEMTSAEEKALLVQQQALVKETGQQLQRAKELARNGAASTADLNTRQREYAAADAGLAALQSRLEDHIILAPFDGILGLRNISVGALLQPGTTITTLDDDSVMKLDFSVPSIYLPALHPGLEIIARADGFTEEFHGTISAVNSQIDEATRSVIVRAVIPNPDAVLKPGLLMKVELLKNPRLAVLVPESAIVPEGRNHSVFVVAGGDAPVAEKRLVEVGARQPGSVEITKGLNVGEMVVTQGTMMAQDGKPVKILTEQAKGESLSDVLKRLTAAKAQSADKAKQGK